MTTEEKAKRYDEISKEVKDFFDGKQKMYSDVEQTLNYLFSELRESEDERIRKDILAFIRREGQHIDKYEWHKWIEWLEKLKDFDKQLEKAHKANEEKHSIIWHNIDEKPEEMREILCEWKSSYTTWHEVGFYHKDDNSFWEGEREITNVIRWIYTDELSKQLSQNKEYTFKSIPRLLDMIEPTDKAKSYCKKLIDTLQTEGYVTDAKIVSDCLKQMNGEKVGMATMDEEKQSPKFHKGDWITNGIETVQIIGYDIDYGYQVDCKGNLQHRDTDIIEKEYHLWSISDAKDGDVLACCDNKPFIFKGFFDLNFPNCLAAYCGVTLENQFGHCNGKTFWTNQDVKPATKEQCNLLFQKMHEAGYEWDAEKKELKEIEFNPDKLIEETYQQQADEVLDIVTEKSAWNEEDEKMVNDIIASIDTLYYHGMVKWLKSIKYRIQPQQKWTEEDESGFGDTLWAIDKARIIAKDENDMGNLWYAENWLRELKERIGG